MQTLEELIKLTGLTATVCTGRNVTHSIDLNDWPCSAPEYLVILKLDGKIYPVPFWTGSACKRPTVQDVMECLLLDVRSPTTFREFCAEFAYSEDSIKARSLFDAIIVGRKALNDLLGDDMLQQFIDCER